MLVVWLAGKMIVVLCVVYYSLLMYYYIVYMACLILKIKIFKKIFFVFDSVRGVLIKYLIFSFFIFWIYQKYI